ncbi:GDP-mannose 6-dehydrogenase [Maioricimonas rarisocia]|uniref:UDP-glucose 6-dehydrogenase n=1 Tax=Maioricimonas rarisocia TaxID=2528026 RepID=A0A517Z0S3_9PLAN|nr:nucleotide sugar dehydrogenase [Maioricimonas rarisocia]QDU36081.1 GDP-mannose 6-dehydrogenase [Maioricimonas rarisocia]
MSRVAVCGMGYVGCVTAACLCRDGHQVIGVDIDERKVASLASGMAPVSEPGLDDLLKQVTDEGRLVATTDINEAVANSDIALIAVGTPSAVDGSIDTNAVERVIASIGQALAESDREYTIVLRSTLLPGVLEDTLRPILEKSLGGPLGDRVRLCNNPEFLRETTAIRDYDRPPFVVVGAEEEWQAEAVLELYSRIDAPRIVTDTRTAALVKYTCNAYHAAKVAFANEIGTLARALGADGQEVMRIACLDTQLNVSPAYLRPGFAFGGSCLPKDVRALTRFAQREAVASPLLSSLLPSNEAHLVRGAQMVEQSGHRKIGLVGLSFKANTDDLRESPLVKIAEHLYGRGYDLRIYDPGVQVSRLLGSNRTYVEQHLPHFAELMVDTPEELCQHAELVVLGTNVADGFDWSSHCGGDVVDLRRDLVVTVHEAAPVT